MPRSTSPAGLCGFSCFRALRHRGTYSFLWCLLFSLPCVLSSFGHLILSQLVNASFPSESLLFLSRPSSCPWFSSHIVQATVPTSPRATAVVRLCLPPWPSPCSTGEQLFHTHTYTHQPAKCNASGEACSRGSRFTLWLHHSYQTHRRAHTHTDAHTFVFWHECESQHSALGPQDISYRSYGKNVCTHSTHTDRFRLYTHTHFPKTHTRTQWPRQTPQPPQSKPTRSSLKGLLLAFVPQGGDYCDLWPRFPDPTQLESLSAVIWDQVSASRCHDWDASVVAAGALLSGDMTEV